VCPYCGRDWSLGIGEVYFSDTFKSFGYFLIIGILNYEESFPVNEV